MIICSFKKCIITMNVNGSENSQVNIQGLEDYVMPAPKEEFHLKTSNEECEDK